MFIIWNYLLNKNLKPFRVEIEIDELKIPNNYGRVPTYNELIDHDAVRGADLYYSGYTENKHIGKKDIIKVAPDLIKLLKVSKNRDVPVFIIDKYEISRISGTLMIYDMNKDKWIYELDMNN